MKSKGKLIVLEGGEGSGKTSVLDWVKEVYGERMIFTREPGGTPFAEDIRNLALKTEGGKHADAITQFSMMWASRAEHFNHKIRPALKQGLHVISDRLDSSTWAYQLFGQEGKDSLKKLFPVLREVVMEDDVPALYIYLDVDPAEGLKRKRIQKSPDGNHFDDQSVVFHERVRQGYMDFFKAVPHRIIDANKTLKDVQVEFLTIIGELLGE